MSIDREEFEAAISALYTLKGWDPATGAPTPERLERLGLEWTCDGVGQALRVKVHLWGELGFYGPGKRGRFEFPIDREMPVVRRPPPDRRPAADVAVLGRNGEVVRLDDPTLTVADGDRIDCFPPTSGG